MNREKTKQLIANIGGPVVIARLLGISSQAVSQWEKVPLERAFEIEEKSDGKFTAAYFRPDRIKDMDINTMELRA